MPENETQTSKLLGTFGKIDFGDFFFFFSIHVTSYVNSQCCHGQPQEWVCVCLKHSNLHLGLHKTDEITVQMTLLQNSTNLDVTEGWNYRGKYLYILETCIDRLK